MIEPLKITDLGSYEEWSAMEIDRLNKKVTQLEKALREVISVSDRKTDIYDRAKAVLGEKKDGMD